MVRLPVDWTLPLLPETVTLLLLSTSVLLACTRPVTERAPPLLVRPVFPVTIPPSESVAPESVNAWPDVMVPLFDSAPVAASESPPATVSIVPVVPTLIVPLETLSAFDPVSTPSTLSEDNVKLASCSACNNPPLAIASVDPVSVSRPSAPTAPVTEIVGLFSASPPSE